MAITVINENDYIRDSREVINNNFNELDTLKAPLNSPALTGTPTTPTPTGGDNSTKIATTAYVKGEVANYLPLSGGSVTGNLSVSGTITGNVTGNVTGNADTATNATNDANGNPITGTYLPLAGGTLTGDVSTSADLSVAGDTSLTNLSVSGTTALAGTSTAPTPSADDNSTKIATTQYVQTEIKPIEADVSVNDKRISNIEKLLQGNLYDYQTDSSSAYTKTVPQGAMPYASLEQIGGRTLVWNQLVTENMFRTKTASSTIGLTLTSTETSINMSGTTDSTTNSYMIRAHLPTNHKFLVTGTPVPNGIALRLDATGSYRDVTENFVFTAEKSISNYTYVGIKASATGLTVNITWTPMLIDLTLMFGAGNEPTTYEEFQQMFPAQYYPYNAGTLLSAGVTEVVSKKADTTTIATYPIPAEVRALEGYGWSAGTVYNYVDFERKVFVQRVASVDLGSLAWNKADSGGVVYRYSQTLSDVIKPTEINDVGNIVSQQYIAGSYRNAYDGAFNCIGIGRTTVNVPYRVAIYDSTKEEMTNAEFKASVSGVYAYYELVTPQEIDISAYLTNDNLIEVEGGGTLTFPNSNGNDYRIPIPSSETYMVDLQASLGE